MLGLTEAEGRIGTLVSPRQCVIAGFPCCTSDSLPWRPALRAKRIPVGLKYWEKPLAFLHVHEEPELAVGERAAFGMKQRVDCSSGHEVPRVGPLALGFLECHRGFVAIDRRLLGGYSRGDDLIPSLEGQSTLPQVHADLLYPWQEKGGENTEDAGHDSRKRDLQSVLKKAGGNNDDAEQPECRPARVLLNRGQDPATD